MVGTRMVVAVAAFTTLVTLYSLSELHSLSVQHAEQERQELVTSSSATSTQTGGSTVTIKPAEEHKQTQSAIVLPTITKAPVKASPKPAAHTANQRKSFTYPNTELWGDVVAWGTQNKAETIEQCGDTCRDFKPSKAEDPDCNVFVWCGDKVACKENYQQCWLKHLSHPEASRPAKQGPEVFWTSGTMDVDINADPSNAKKTGSPESRRFHIITSAQGAAVHWQARIHYYWYKKQKSICEKAGGCEMGGFTRLLHSGAADDLMDEIPTIVVDPLPQDMVEHSWYVVLNRPYAFVQWVQKHKIPERFVLMSEPDHIFLRPIPNFMTGDRPAAFPFFYIEPAKAEHARITQKFTGQISRKQLEEIAPIGNSPTFMTWEDMQKTMPIWMNTSIAIFKDTEANQVWGWVQEMYGFTIAAWLAGIKKFDLFLNMMAQPPWDTTMNMTKNKPFYILHYTYGMDYKLTGEFTPGKIGAWRFDKRSYGGKPIPRNMGPPPVNMKNDLVRALINSFNEATDAIPCWTEYQEAGGKMPKECHEAPKHFLLEELNAKKAKEGGVTIAATTAKTSAT